MYWYMRVFNNNNNKHLYGRHMAGMTGGWSVLSDIVTLTTYGKCSICWRHHCTWLLINCLIGNLISYDRTSWLVFVVGEGESCGWELQLGLCCSVLGRLAVWDTSPSQTTRLAPWKSRPQWAQWQVRCSYTCCYIQSIIEFVLTFFRWLQSSKICLIVLHLTVKINN